MLGILGMLLMIAVYFAYREEEDNRHENSKVSNIDNARLAYDMHCGVSFAERKKRLASGYYAKL